LAKVEIYTRDFCGYCSRAKSLLSRKGVDFIEHDAGMDVDLRREMVQRSNGGTTFPQIFINDRHIGGCDDMVQLEATGRLDPLLEQPAEEGSAPAEAG
jgi:glutaredoxin 3